MVTISLMVTGDFRGRASMIDAARSSAVAWTDRSPTTWASRPGILGGTTHESVARILRVGIRAVDVLNCAWQQQLARLGRGKPVRPNLQARTGRHVEAVQQRAGA